MALAQGAEQGGRAPAVLGHAFFEKMDFGILPSPNQTCPTDHENGIIFGIWSFWKAWEAFENREIGLLLAKEVLPEFLACLVRNSGRTSMASKSPILRN